MGHILSAPETWVAVAFVIFVILVWKPAQKALLSGLDARAARIEKELSEAARLREEAQALLAQYQRKHRDAMKEADGIITHAREEADRLAQQAARDLEVSLKRREELAMQRIAQAEQQATADVRAAAVDVAIAATERLLKEKLDGAKGDALIDQAIKELPAKLH
jgi:F-type H+-transporting ATPase subunit b